MEAVNGIFAVGWLALLVFLILLINNACPVTLSGANNTNSNSNNNTIETANNNDQEQENLDNTFDYNENVENFEPNNPSDLGDVAAPQEDVANQQVRFEAPLDNSDALVQNVVQDDGNEISVEGTDALIAVTAERFFSINSIGQSNKNASNDLRGDVNIAYNENYTPFNQSAIYVKPLVPGGRL